MNSPHITHHTEEKDRARDRMEFVGCDSDVTMIDRSIRGKRERKAGQGTNYDVGSSAEEEGWGV